MAYEVNVYIGITPDSLPRELPDLPNLGKDHMWFGIAALMQEEDYQRIFPNGETTDGIKQLLKEMMAELE